MATGKAKSLDKMTMRELVKTRDVLGLSDEDVASLSDARSRIRSALKAAKKKSSWSPGKVGRTVTSLAGFSVFQD